MNLLMVIKNYLFSTKPYTTSQPSDILRFITRIEGRKTYNASVPGVKQDTNCRVLKPIASDQGHFLPKMYIGTAQ